MQFHFEDFINTLFHDSLRTAQNMEKTPNRQGGIFAVKQKEHLQTAYGVQGDIITSKKQLCSRVNNYSHFTPNPYLQYRYTNRYKEYVKGFEEQNLLQVNTFVIDIDTKNYSPQEILLACLDDSIGTPTLLLESTRGYQLYFILSKPLHLKKGGVGLAVAKKIAAQLKKSLTCVGADIFCNDFGFFRMPTKKNVLWVDLTHTYDISQLINWSQQQEDDTISFFVSNNSQRQSLTQQEWFKALLQTPDIHGGKGVLGRNNTLFTLALACYADQISFSDAMCTLGSFNAQLLKPLSAREFHAIMKSAYSGRYQGPERFYIEQLTEAYTNVKPYVNYKGWCKHKKERAARTRSHLSEWEQDLITYIEAQPHQDGFLWTTQRELCKTLGIPKSTLNKLLKHSNIVLTRTFGKGRNAMTGFTTRTLFNAEMVSLYLRKKKHTKKQYLAFLTTYIHAVEACDVSLARTSFIEELQQLKMNLINGPQCHYISISRHRKSTAIT